MIPGWPETVVFGVVALSFAGMLVAYWRLGWGIDPISNRRKSQPGDKGWSISIGFCLSVMVLGIALIWMRSLPSVFDQWKPHNVGKGMPQPIFLPR